MRLVRMREIELRPWKEIAACFPGRSVNACESRWWYLYNHATGRRRIQRWLPARDRRACQAAPSARTKAPASRCALLIDAELRARIEVQGITAGLLGDPLPGRSALDRREKRA